MRFIFLLFRYNNKNTRLWTDLILLYNNFGKYHSPLLVTKIHYFSKLREIKQFIQ